MQNIRPLFLFTALVTCFTLTGQNRVKMHEGVSIGGINQWIGATGKDSSKPLLLFLHGGPGFSSRTYSGKFVKHLKKDFIVAQWDQRGAGITAAWNPTDSISISAMKQDTEEVVRFLLKQFDKEKIYLVGFSWGNVLGLDLALRHPELLHAYVAVSPTLAGNAAELRTLQTLKSTAEEQKNQEAINELAQITVPIRSWEELYYQRKWTAHFIENNFSERTYPKRLFEDWSVRWMDIYTQACAIDYRNLASSIDCPIFFFLSKKDYVANYQIAVDYYTRLKADQKEIIWFEDSYHLIPTDEPKKFSEALIRTAESR